MVNTFWCGAGIFLGGTAVGAIGAALGIYFYDKSIKNPDAGQKLEDLCDDRYMADELAASDLADWFRRHNADGSFQNLMIQPTEENMSQYKMGHLFKTIPEKCLFEIIYDSNSSSIKRFRLVQYDSIQPRLQQMLDEGNGVLIVE